MQSTAKEGDHDAGADAADAGSGDESEGDNFGGDVGATRVDVINSEALTVYSHFQVIKAVNLLI